jgi:hypothetical protein
VAFSIRLGLGMSSRHHRVRGTALHQGGSLFPEHLRTYLRRLPNTPAQGDEHVCTLVLPSILLGLKQRSVFGLSHSASIGRMLVPSGARPEALDNLS